MRSKIVIASFMYLVIGLCVLLLAHTVIADQKMVTRGKNKQTRAVQTAAGQPETAESQLLDGIREHVQALKTQQKRLLPEEASVSAPFVSQYPELPNGCEVTSLTMLLRAAGIPADKMTLAEQMAKVPYSSGDFMGNPNEGFVGNMYNGDTNHPGLAVYHAPVANLARKYLGNRVLDLTGSSWREVEEQIAAGHPVWVITSINFLPVADSQWVNWHTQQGDMKVSFQEHSVLVTGYDSDEVRFNDPQLTSGGERSTGKSAFITAWNQFGRQAITIRQEEK
jgi:Uncharacterized protein conserved in bacteria